MNRHYAEGYQRVFINDLCDIEKRLQEYDPELYIMWNPNNNTWLVMDGVTEHAIMKIPQVGLETLDARVYRRIREIHIEGFSATKEIEKANERRQNEAQRDIDDLAYNLAKDMERPIKQLAYYGNAG